MEIEFDNMTALLKRTGKRAEDLHMGEFFDYKNNRCMRIKKPTNSELEKIVGTKGILAINLQAYELLIIPVDEVVTLTPLRISLDPESINSVATPSASGGNEKLSY